MQIRVDLHALAKREGVTAERELRVAAGASPSSAVFVDEQAPAGLSGLDASLAPGDQDVGQAVLWSRRVDVEP